MNYFDLHCDTPYELYCNSLHFDSNELHVSLDKTEAAFEHYGQFAAYCAPSRLSDEAAFERYVNTVSYFFNEAERLSDRVLICKDYSDLVKAENLKKAAIFPTVEDARIIGNDLSRIDLLYKNKCRILTAVWGGTSCIGGAHNTDTGLTDFGKAAMRRCFEIGIVPDISHASEKTADDLAMLVEEYKKPFIATHSNSYSVYSHSRNLRDRHFLKIKELHGIVGISLCNVHIQPSSSGTVGIDGVIRHIEHYLSLGGEDTLAFGCDFDGCGLPVGFESISDVVKLPDRLAQLGYSDALLEKLTYGNAREFIKRNLK